jgi:hypothetical protein
MLKDNNMAQRNFNINLTGEERRRIGKPVKALRSDSGISQKDLAFKVMDFSRPDFPDRERNFL